MTALQVAESHESSTIVLILLRQRFRFRGLKRRRREAETHPETLGFGSAHESKGLVWPTPLDKQISGLRTKLGLEPV